MAQKKNAGKGAQKPNRTTDKKADKKPMPAKAGSVKSENEDTEERMVESPHSTKKHGTPPKMKQDTKGGQKEQLHEEGGAGRKKGATDAGTTGTARKDIQGKTEETDQAQELDEIDESEETEMTGEIPEEEEPER